MRWFSRNKESNMSAPSYRTSSLFHFTKKLDVLKSILRTGIVPNFCKEDLSYEDRKRIVGVPMVSFCDIPLTRTSGFKQRYGEFAIGLSKDWAIRNKINPILYVNDLRILYSLSFFNSYRQSLQEEVKKRGGNEKGINVNLRSPESLEGIKFFINWNNANDAIYCLYGYVKKYNSPGPRGKEVVNYIENEWRYVVTGEGANWKWSEKEYKAWRGGGEKPEPTEALKNFKLKFKVDDISYIIVEKDDQISDMVDYILGLESIGGNDEPMPDDDKKLLLTKIISQEKIEKDF